MTRKIDEIPDSLLEEMIELCAYLDSRYDAATWSTKVQAEVGASATHTGRHIHRQLKRLELNA
jgi:hypothetical protein